MPEKIKNASDAAEGICKWVIAICKYDIVFKNIQPKRDELKKAQEKLDEVRQELQKKQNELNQLKTQQEQLTLELADQQAERDLLQA